MSSVAPSLPSSMGSHGVRLTDEEDNVLCEMCGEVVVDVGKQRANTMDVEVFNPELKAFGTFTCKSTRMAIFISVFFQTLKICISIALEKEASEFAVRT